MAHGRSSRCMREHRLVLESAYRTGQAEEQDALVMAVTHETSPVVACVTSPVVALTA